MELTLKASYVPRASRVGVTPDGGERPKRESRGRSSYARQVRDASLHRIPFLV